MILHVLASGSSGNCYCIETLSELIFVDMGISAAAAGNFLKTVPENKKISAVITHEHTDHIKGLGTFVKHYDPCVYASGGTLSALHRMGISKKRLYPLIRDKYYEFDTFALRGFDVPHDAAEPFGYVVMTERCNIAFLTDLGYIAKEHLMHLKCADLLVLEANYDKSMLKSGKYPAYLKRRIASSKGHLSNEEAMMAVASLADGHLSRCLFAHVSEENNDYHLLEQLGGFCLQNYAVPAHVLRQKTYYHLTYPDSQIISRLNNL